MLRIRRRSNAPPVQPWVRRRVSALSIALSPENNPGRLRMPSIMVTATACVDGRIASDQGSASPESERR